METKDLEWFKENLQVVIDGYEAKFSELKSEIKDLKSENRSLKSENGRLKSDIMNYQVTVNCLTRILEENKIILKENK